MCFKIRQYMAEKNLSVGGRGTSRRTIKKGDKTTSGPMFANLGEKQKSQSAGQFISVGRGTGKIKFEDAVKTSTKTPKKGRWVRTGRGTGKIWVD